jgi:hypothetical protein
VAHAFLLNKLRITKMRRLDGAAVPRSLAAQHRPSTIAVPHNIAAPQQRHVSSYVSAELFPLTHSRTRPYDTFV